jgi:hypothetical protein
MEDMFGTAVNIGDEVAFVTSGRRTKLRKGVFAGVCPSGGVRIYTVDEDYDWNADTCSWVSVGSHRTAHILQRNMFVKLNPEQPVWRWLGTKEISR